MATTVGESVQSDELVVAQFDEVAAGTTVESLVIKFEGYLQLSSASGNASRKCGRVVYFAQPRVAEVTKPEESIQAVARGSFPPKPVEAEPKVKDANPKAAEWVVERSSQAPVQEETTFRIDADHAFAVGMNAPLSKRAKQRRRKAFARLEAQSLISCDDLNYYSGRRRAKQVSQVPNVDEPLKSGEPNGLGEPHFMSQVPNYDEPLKSGEPHFMSYIPNFGEPLKSGEPNRLGELHFLSQVPGYGEPLKTGETNSSGGLHQTPSWSNL